MTVRSRTALICAASMTMLGLAAGPASAVEGPVSGGSPLEVVDKAQHGDSQTLTFDNGAKFTSTPTSAFKSGSFNWYAKFQIGFNTRHYTAGSGTHTFTTSGVHNLSGNASANCSSNAKIQVTLYAEDFPGDDSFGTKTVSCTRGGTVKWSGVRADTFYYYVRVTGNYDSSDLYSRKLNGTIRYP